MAFDKPVKSSKEILKEYELYKKIKQEPISVAEYARRNNLDRQKCIRLCYLIEFIKYKNPEKYQYIWNLLNEYYDSKLSVLQIKKKTGLTTSIISNFLLHVKYKNIIDEFEGVSKNEERLKKVDVRKMNFISVKTDTESSQKEISTINEFDSSNPEVIPPKNDLEIIINRDIKMVISPQVTPEKLVKIIEFLRGI